MTLLLLTCCAILSTLTPDPTNISNPRAGDPPCIPGPWRIECPACSPPVALVGVASCVGLGTGARRCWTCCPGSWTGGESTTRKPI